MKTTLLKRGWLGCSLMVPTPLAGAIALVIITVTAPSTQGQSSSPQGSPTSQSSSAGASLQSSGYAETMAPVNISGNVIPSNLIYHVEPVFPPVARSAHVTGTIRLHCIIGTDGAVQYVQYVSGPPLLMKSAMDAVKQWRYKPTVIDDKPVEVSTMVSLVFTLGEFPAPAAQEIEKGSVYRYQSGGYVNDFAGVLDSEDKSQLNLICKDLDGKKEIQLFIVTMESVDGQPIKDFATQLGNLWGVGHRGTNRGLLALLSIEDRQYYIAVGLGLESTMPNEEADRLGREMLPTLQKGNYGEALRQLAKNIQIEIAPRVE